MALYEYVCRECDTTFDVRRAIGEADRDVRCPHGHTEVRRKLSVFASVGGAGRAAPSIGGGGGGGGGGCCGGACGCGR